MYGRYLLSFLFVVTLSFFLIYKIPAGDPVKVMLGFQTTEENVQRFRQELGLDRSIFIQYLLYWKRLLKWDLGRSIISDFDIGQEFVRRFPLTLLLVTTATVLALFGGVSFGLLSTLTEKIGSIITPLIVGVGSIPVFYLGLIAVWFFGYSLNLFPISGYGGGVNVIPPGLVLALAPMANIARITEIELTQVMKQDFIRTAYAMGFSRWKVVSKFAMKNVFLSLISSLSNSFALLLSGTFFVEYVFGWPGMGLLAVDAMLNYDYPLIQGVVLLTALSFIVINLATDFLYRLVDPRIKE
jgi:ABC-type dipeptide/oligopeptide/nickel transport system permease component